MEALVAVEAVPRQAHAPLLGRVGPGSSIREKRSRREGELARVLVEDAFRPPANVDERESGWRRLLIALRRLVGVLAGYGDEMFADPDRLPLRALCRLRLRCGLKPVP